MDLIEKLKADLAKGFSKTQLEKCIGLPVNSLSGIIAGTKEISKISRLKIEQWEKSEKPNPLSLVVPKKKKEITTYPADPEAEKQIGDFYESEWSLKIEHTPPTEKDVEFFMNIADKAVKKEQGIVNEKLPIVSIENINKQHNKVEPQKPAGSEKSNVTINTKKEFSTDHLGGNTIEEIFDYSRVEERMKPQEGEKSISEQPYNVIPPMPKKEDFKHSVDYGAAKSEWKLKYGQK